MRPNRSSLSVFLIYLTLTCVVMGLVAVPQTGTVQAGTNPSLIIQASGLASSPMREETPRPGSSGAGMALAMVMPSSGSDPAPVKLEAGLGAVPPEGEKVLVVSKVRSAHLPASAWDEPAGCLQPGTDLTRIHVSNVILNRRTYAMLAYAASLYDGKIDILGKAILRGGYLRDDPTRTGIYTGGGVVDLSIGKEGKFKMQYDEVEPLIAALRTAGFAAWLRGPDELHPGSQTHIHAVAIGDERLSEAARAELEGENGYFRGYAGLPGRDGQPKVDPHGGPLFCRWMLESGYTDLRPPELRQAAFPYAGWQENLRQASRQYVTTSMEDSVRVAKSLRFIDGRSEHPANMCGPLAGALLREAGLLPKGAGPANNLHSFWLANPRQTGLPFTLFPKRDYDMIRFKPSVENYDPAVLPLLPGDFIYTYASYTGFDHMFVVTEVDEAGRAYTVTNQHQGNGVYLIQRLMLYDPQDPTAGAFHNEWIKDARIIGQTGTGGFTLIRRKGLTLPPGSRHEYLVRPGDTLASVAARFNSTASDISRENGLQNSPDLQPGAALIVPVNTQPANAAARASLLPPKTLAALKSPPNTFGAAAKPPLIAALPDSLTRNALAVEENAESAALQKMRASLSSILASAPAGDWGVYIENLDSGETISLGEEISFHPASTIKLAVAAAFLHWLDDHPEVSLSNGPVARQRSYEQLLRAMLIRSEEVATSELIAFLERQPGDYTVQKQIDRWGMAHTTLQPRRSTPADLALLLRQLHRGQLLSDQSTRLMLEILRTPSRGDELRLGGGMPSWARRSLAHKYGTVFDDGWGVVADVGLVNLPEGNYAVVVLSNYVDWLDYERAQATISAISQVAFEQITGLSSNDRIPIAPMLAEENTPTHARYSASGHPLFTFEQMSNAPRLVCHLGSQAISGRCVK